MATAPMQGLEAPAPVPSPHGLLAQAPPLTQLLDDDARWEAGFKFVPETCGDGSTWRPCPPGGMVNEDEIGDSDGFEARPPQTEDDVDGADAGMVVAYTPFEILAEVNCGTRGWTAVDYEGRAGRILLANQSKLLEFEFWEGAVEPANYSLRGSTLDAEVLAGGTAVSPKEAVAQLSQALADCPGGSRGMIHATARTAARFQDAGAVIWVDGHPVTARGDMIIPGSGYTGNGPTAETDHGDAGANTAWAYATGMVYTRLGQAFTTPERFEEAVHRATNRLSFVTGRMAAAVIDGCCMAAVLVDLTAAT